ncbi:putative oligopeptide ABC transporter, ATP-binding protein, partial [Vibrio parahaemolyticus V-223/04]
KVEKFLTFQKKS